LPVCLENAYPCPPKLGVSPQNGKQYQSDPQKGHLQFIPGIFFGRGGGAGAMFRRGMSTLLRVEGEGGFTGTGLEQLQMPSG